MDGDDDGWFPSRRVLARGAAGVDGPSARDEATDVTSATAAASTEAWPREGGCGELALIGGLMLK